MKDKNVLECAICSRMFSEDDVTHYLYFPSSHLCYDCCERMWKSPRKVSCFGKAQDGKKIGYDSTALECSKLCPDRAVCRMFVMRKLPQYKDLTMEARKAALKFLLRKPRKAPPSAEVFRKGTAIEQLFTLCCKGCTMQKFNAKCAAIGANRGWALRTLRREHSKGHEWTWQEEGGNIRITYKG